MPILPLSKTAGFDPEATKTLASAFDAAWDVLRRSGSTLAADNMVAFVDVQWLRMWKRGWSI
jgi:hypothetical protein